MQKAVQVQIEDDIFSEPAKAKKRLSEEKLGPPPRPKPKIHLYSEAVKKSETYEKSLQRRYQSVYVAPVSEIPTNLPPPAKGYRVHRSRNLSDKSSVQRKPRSEQHTHTEVNKLLYATDVLNCNRFLIDTGASVSILNYKPQPDEKFDEYLCQADGSPIKTYGTVQKKISLGSIHSSTDYVHDFVRADVEGPVLGSDFMSKFDLLVDCRRGELVPRYECQSKPVICAKVSAEDASAQISKVCCPEYLKNLVSEFSNISGASFSNVKPKQRGSQRVD